MAWARFEGTVSRYDVHLCPHPDPAGQRQAVRVGHDKAAARHPATNPLGVVVAVYPVNGPFSRPVRQGYLEWSHVVQRVSGRDRRREIDSAPTEHMPGVRGRIPPWVKIDAGHPAEPERIGCEPPDGGTDRIFGNGRLILNTLFLVECQHIAADTDFYVIRYLCVGHDRVRDVWLIRRPGFRAQGGDRQKARCQRYGKECLEDHNKPISGWHAHAHVECSLRDLKQGVKWTNKDGYIILTRANIE